MDRAHLEEIEGQMRAAAALIESLEEEVTSLRRDLDQASVAVKAAQEEVAAREKALEEKEEARSAAQQKAEDLLNTLTHLRIHGSDEQLNLTNQHIAELARLQDRAHDERRAEIEAALSAGDAEALREEYRKVQEEAEQRYARQSENLTKAYREAQDRLQRSEQELERQRVAEAETLRVEAEKQQRDLEGRMRKELERRLEENRRSAAERYESELKAIREASGQREAEIRKDFEARREQLEEQAREAGEQHQAELQEIKSLAEKREQELKKAQSTRLAEAKDEADRRVESLQAQREADNRALRKHYEEEMARLRQRYDERLAEEIENGRLEAWTLEEKLEGFKLERAAQVDAYRNRLKELEAARLAEKPVEGGPEEPPVQAPSQEESPQEVVPLEAARRLQDRVSELEDELAEAGRMRAALERELEEFRDQEPSEMGSPDQNGHEQEAGGQPGTDELNAEAVRAQERILELEDRLREARDENRRATGELEKTRERLQRVSEPDHLLRTGIAAFNASEHARHVASISKALGLPKVRADLGGEETDKPVLTFAWEDLAWRRYVADPAAGLGEQQVYLIASSDNLGDAKPAVKEPNARIDARGQLILGVQAR